MRKNRQQIPQQQPTSHFQNEQSEASSIVGNELSQKQKQKFGSESMAIFNKLFQRIINSFEHRTIIVILVFILVTYFGLSKIIKSDPSAENQTFPVFLQRAINQMQTVTKYINVQKYEHNELPICLIVSAAAAQTNDLVNVSIKQQNYSNLHASYLNFQQIFKENELNYHSKKSIDLLEVQTHEHSAPTFAQIVQKIKKECPQKYPILTFVSKPLRLNSLQKINSYFQNYQAWLLFHTEKQANFKQSVRNLNQNHISNAQILSVYLRVFEFVETNNQSVTDRRILMGSFNPLFVMTSLFEMCKFNSLPVRRDDIFLATEATPNLLSVNLRSSQKNWPKYNRVPYQEVYNLYQNYRLLDRQILKKNREAFQKSQKTLTATLFLFPLESKFSHKEIQQVLQFEQLIFLPTNHTLNKVQRGLLEQKYEIYKYGNNQLPLCININSRNNIQNERYKKVLDSVTSQNYTNYQIVFIDDVSDDDTLIKSKQYLLNQLNFNKEKATFIRNKVHKFATYNILNAGFTYCQNGSIQVIVDGDDQLIGKQVFQVINAQYQKNDLWAYYNSYITDKFYEGISQPFSESILTGMFGGRKLVHFFGPLRTFKTSLLKQIPTGQHLDYFGNFFTTMYDTALQYPLFQLSGAKHAKFEAYMSYLYSENYGANDDSNFFKKVKRIFTHVWVSFKNPLKRVQQLDDTKMNFQLKSLFLKQNGTFYEEVN